MSPVVFWYSSSHSRRHIHVTGRQGGRASPAGAARTVADWCGWSRGAGCSPRDDRRRRHSDARIGTGRSARRSRRRRTPSRIPPTMRVEDWTEPWVWRPEDWPGQPLTLQIVGNRHLPRAVSPGNRFTPLYSFNGASPGPTIRMRGDAVLRVKLRNMLGPNHGQVPKGPAPDPFEIPPDDLEAALCAMSKAQGGDCSTPPTRVLEHLDELLHHMPATLVDTSCLSSPANVPHGSHTTNLHTHGLHVEPGTNPNGTQGDNTFLRILPQGRLGDPPARRRRMPSARSSRTSASPKRTTSSRSATSCDRERGRRGAVPAASAGHALVSPALPRRDARSGRQRPRRLPHRRRRRRRCDQPGDDGDASGRIRPMKTGPFDYRERLMMIQRVEVSSLDMDAGPRRNQARAAAAGRDQRRLLADGDVHAAGRRRALARAQRERRRPRHEELHGARRAVRVRGSPAVEGEAGRERRRAARSSSRRRGRTSSAATRTHLPAVVRRHHARRRRERPRAAHDQGSLEAERRVTRTRSIGQPARGRGPDAGRCCATSRTATATARACATCSSGPTRSS